MNVGCSVLFPFRLPPSPFRTGGGSGRVLAAAVQTEDFIRTQLAAVEAEVVHFAPVVEGAPAGLVADREAGQSAHAHRHAAAAVPRDAVAVDRHRAGVAVLGEGPVDPAGGLRPLVER